MSQTALKPFLILSMYLDFVNRGSASCSYEWLLVSPTWLGSIYMAPVVFFSPFPVMDIHIELT